MDQPLVVITGASSGIGAATAQAFSQAGHPLLLLARRIDRMEALGLPNTICRQVDVRDRQAVADAVAEGEKAYGPTDCLFKESRSFLGAGWAQGPVERMSNTADGLDSLPETKRRRRRKR